MNQTQDKLAAYNIPTYLKNKKREVHSKSNSLPSIQNNWKQFKINSLRNQIGGMEDQITTLKARINSLKIQKGRHLKRKQRNQSQMKFIQTVRQRIYQDAKYKKEILQMREKQLEELKLQANFMRDQMMKNNYNAKTITYTQKYQQAQNKKKIRKQNEEMIKQIRNKELELNRLKAQNVKKSQQHTEQKMKQFNQSRISFARQNHHNKVQRSNSQKQKLDKIIMKLKKKQQKLLQQYKQSEASMLSSLYELQDMNPERKKKLSKYKPQSKNKQIEQNKK